MKKSLIPLFALLTACASNHTFTSAPQNYRFANSEKLLTVTGKVDQQVKTGVFVDTISSLVTIKINDEIHITGSLDQNFTAELRGKPFEGKPTSATCTSKQSGQNTIELTCAVFIQNERVANLVM